MRLYNYRAWIIAVCLLLGIGTTYFALQLRFDFQQESFYPSDAKDRQFYQYFIEELEPDYNFLAVAIRGHRGVFDSSFLAAVAKFSRSSLELEQVIRTQSLVSLEKPLHTPFGLVAIPFLHFEEPGRYVSDSLKLVSDPRIQGRFLSLDASSLLVLLRIPEELPHKEAVQFLDRLDELCEDPEFAEVHVAGSLNSATHFLKTLQRDFLNYTLMATALFIIALILVFRKVLAVLIALSTALLTMSFFFGLLGILGESLTYMSPLYPILILVIGSSDIIHIMTKYIDEMRLGKSREAALKATLSQVGLATFLTSLTTAIGFLSLLSSNISLIREFGIYSAIGVSIAYLSTMGFTCSLLLYTRLEQLVPKTRSSEFWDQSMQRLHEWVLSHKKQIGITAAIVFGLCLFGISLISTNVYLMSDFTKDNPVRQDFEYFEQHFDGIRSFEVAVIPSNSYSVDDPKVLNAMEELGSYLESTDEIGTVYSQASLYKSLNRAYNSDQAAAYALPETEREFIKYQKLIDAHSFLERNVLINEDKDLGRITASMHDVGSDKINLMNLQISEWIQQHIDSSIVSFKLTGGALLANQINEFIRTNLFTGLGIAFLIVSIIMILLFRDLKLFFLSLIPNLFPLLIAGAIMGYFSIELKASISIIFTIIFGIAVDDTIHFLTRFKLEHQTTKNVVASVRTTFRETGKAICITSMILTAGFLILVTSDFATTYYIGLLISLTLASALVTDLLLTPVMIYWLFKDANENVDLNR